MAPLTMVQEAGAHHRRQRQRHHGRHDHGDRHRHCEFTEQAPDDTAHEQHGYEHRDQRGADRHDGEADFGGAFDGGLHRPHTVLDVSENVFQHHDGVVDHEPDRDRQRHQRQVIQAVVHQIHHREGADQRDRHGDGWDNGGPEVPQEQEDDRHHQPDGQHQGELHVLDGRPDRQRAVDDGADRDGRRDRRLKLGQRGLDALHRIDDVGTRLLEDQQHDAALAVLQPAHIHILGRIDRSADVADPNGRAGFPAQDDVGVLVRLGELIVGVNRVSPLLRVDRTFGRVDRGADQHGPHILHREAHRREFRRIHLHPDSALLLARDKHLRHACQLRYLLRQHGVGVIVHLDQRQRVGIHRQNQDRCFRRVHFVVVGGRWQIFRQLPAGRVDRRLNIARRRVDVAVEVELDGDLGRTLHADRRHLRDAGDLRELPLQRLRHGGGHGFGAGAGEFGVHVDGRKIDARQRRDRQQRISGEPDQNHRGDEQRGADGAVNEGSRDAHARACPRFELSTSPIIHQGGPGWHRLPPGCRSATASGRP